MTYKQSQLRFAWPWAARDRMEQPLEEDELVPWRHYQQSFVVCIGRTDPAIGLPQQACLHVLLTDLSLCERRESAAVALRILGIFATM